MMQMDLTSRQKQLSELQTTIQDIDQEVTLILQSLQWDQKRLSESWPMVTCKYDGNHNVPQAKKEIHEKACFINYHGYSKDNILPDPFDDKAHTLVKLKRDDIREIIKNAAQSDPHFVKGTKCVGLDSEPWSLDRLQCTYTGDERRAIHDAVVRAVPSCHDLADLALPSSSNGEQKNKQKSRMEILAELRDMKRRRAKYRVSVRSHNYSHVLRDVIKTQMELYSEAQIEANKFASKTNTNKDRSQLKKYETYPSGSNEKEIKFIDISKDRYLETNSRNTEVKLRYEEKQFDERKQSYKEREGKSREYRSKEQNSSKSYKERERQKEESHRKSNHRTEEKYGKYDYYRVDPMSKDTIKYVDDSRRKYGENEIERSRKSRCELERKYDDSFQRHKSRYDKHSHSSSSSQNRSRDIEHSEKSQYFYKEKHKEDKYRH